jgi:hypothetical protein
MSIVEDLVARWMVGSPQTEQTFNNEVVCRAVYKYAKGEGPEPYSPTVAELTGFVFELIRADRNRRKSKLRGAL